MLYGFEECCEVLLQSAPPGNVSNQIHATTNASTNSGNGNRGTTIPSNTFTNTNSPLKQKRIELLEKHRRLFLNKNPL